jgi:lysozyme family protein
MPSDMNAILEHTFAQEGGILVRTNRSGDTGGETVGGVSRVKRPNLSWWSDVDSIRPLNDWPRGYTVDLGDFIDTHDGEVASIRKGVVAEYHSDAWLYKPADPSRRVHVTDIESQRVAAKLLSIKINGGPGLLKPCVRALQKRLGIGADGICGPGTAGRINSYIAMDADGRLDDILVLELVAVLTHRQCISYSRICQKNPAQLVNFAGWLNRAFSDLI